MTDSDSGQARRRRRQVTPSRETGKQPGSKQSRERGERGLHDLVGCGPSQVGVQGALRARDVNRPTDEDLAAAERDVVIVRRNWKPPV
ncbi:MAG: hypothetical protein ABI232_10525 [Jatrophihabitantaceae bacterium]